MRKEILAAALIVAFAALKIGGSVGDLEISLIGILITVFIAIIVIVSSEKRKEER